MSSPGISPKSALRKSLLKSYRARGHGNNNLWLAFSVKTDRDWILPSDRHLIHWLYYLETNPDVVSFDLASDGVISPGCNQICSTEIDAVVVYRSGQILWHEVKARKSVSSEEKSLFRVQDQVAADTSAKYLRFDDQDFVGEPMRIGLRWLKPLAYAEVIRGQELNHYRFALATYCNYEQGGTVKGLLEALRPLDPAILLGMLTRFAIGNVLTLNLPKSPFGPETRWHSNDHQE